jgi:hypothetical protein
MKSEICPAFGPAEHTCEFEFVPSAKKARAIYIRFDGERIAYRGAPDSPQAKTWVTMVPGYEVIDATPDVLEIRFAGEVLQ